MPVAASGSAASPSQATAFAVGTAWEDWVNTKLGGIDGHPVKIVMADTKADPATSISVADSMIQNDKVIAEVGGTDNIADSAWVKAFTDAGIPVIGGSGGVANVWDDSPLVFHLNADATTYAGHAVDAAKLEGKDKFGAVLCTEAPACAGLTKVWQARVQKVGGLSFTNVAAVSATQPDYTAACLALKQAGADFIGVAVGTPVLIDVTRDCSAQGYTPAYGLIGASTYGPDVIPLSKSGTEFAGSLSGFPWWIDTPAVETYRSVMQTYSPGKAVPETGTASTTWASLEMFRYAMTHASADQPITPQRVLSAMDSISNVNLGGLLPQPVTFTSGKPVAAMTCGWFFKLSNSVFSGGEQPTCLNQ